MIDYPGATLLRHAVYLLLTFVDAHDVNKYGPSILTSAVDSLTVSV